MFSRYYSERFFSKIIEAVKYTEPAVMEID